GMIPKSLRSWLLILVIIVAGLPVLLSGYYIAKTVTQGMMAEKQQKLFGAAKMLDYYLVGTYDDILQKNHVENADKATKIKILNQELRSYTNDIARAYPGIGVGYYSRELDAIITYGPSDIYDSKVGLPISNNHEGRMVMTTGIPRVQEGDLIRGEIMNAMQPVIRNNNIIGYVWANELTVNVEAQVKDIIKHIYWAIAGSVIVGITGIIFLLNQLMKDINSIKSGLIKIKENLSYRIFPPNGEIGEIATAINDMAHGLEERKILEEKVQRTDRLAVIGEMAAGLAHEIRNPLMAIKGFTQLQNEDITLVERQEYIDIIIHEVDRMNHLIEELLGFSRPILDFVTRINVNEVLQNTLVLAEIRANGTDVLFKKELGSDLPEVMANEEQLRQVFLNVLINAIQAMDKKGNVIISSCYEELADSVRISFTDTGPGIEPEDIKKLFDPFFTTKANGTGLGLSVANHLMLSWNGIILVESKIDYGSTFTLIFPAVKG
ncbi:MAG: signal transduction histidine kinase, nitrogen specific, NtrB, partial [Firmicutes bacterium]|nr:signal transduction histidine kinase, nitrogen specific, NtrB [Bacillota bacterium]